MGQCASESIPAFGGGAPLSFEELALPLSGSLSQPLLIVDRAAHKVYRLDGSGELMQLRKTDAGRKGEGRGARSVAGPRGIAAERSGSFVVAEWCNNRVSRWTRRRPQGQAVAGLDGRGAGPEQLACPGDVSYDRRGNLLVADSD